MREKELRALLEKSSLEYVRSLASEVILLRGAIRNVCGYDWRLDVTEVYHNRRVTSINKLRELEKDFK